MELCAPERLSARNIRPALALRPAPASAQHGAWLLQLRRVVQRRRPMYPWGRRRRWAPQGAYVGRLQPLPPPQPQPHASAGPAAPASPVLADAVCPLRGRGGVGGRGAGRGHAAGLVLAMRGHGRYLAARPAAASTPVRSRASVRPAVSQRIRLSASAGCASAPTPERAGGSRCTVGA